MQKTNIILALVLASTLISAATAYTEDKDVLVLGDKDLDQALEEFEYVLVEFYAPWCGHCQKLAPEYAKAASALKKQGVNVKLAKVDCTVEKETAEKHDIEGFPTLKFYAKGEASAYEGGRTERDIVNWLRRKTQPIFREVTTAQELAMEISSNEILVIYFGEKDTVAYHAFDAVTKEYEDITFIHTSNSKLKAEQRLADDKNVLLLKKFDERRAEFAYDPTMNSLEKFVESHRYPLILPFDDKTAQIIFENGLTAVVLMHKKGASKEVEGVFKEAAQKLKGAVQFSVSDFEDGELGASLAEFAGVKESNLPAVAILASKKKGITLKYILDKEATVDNIVEFYEKFSKDKVKPFFKSEPIPTENDEAVKVVVARSFKEIVEDSDVHVLIEFYAPWCGHCQALEPVWADLGETLNNRKDIVIAKIDASANEVESVEISGFPTIIFFPKGDKMNPVEYNGRPNKKDIMAWLEERTSM